MKNRLKIGLVLLALSNCFISCELDDEGNIINGGEVLINESIETPAVWTSDKTYVVDGWIYVNANLTVQPGTVIKFKTGSALNFGYNNSSTIVANGTSEKRITFTSYSSSSSAGAWYGVYFYSNTLENSSITYCEFNNAGASNYDAIGIYGCRLTFNNNIIKNAKSNGIGVDYEGSFVSMTGNTIENCGTHVLKLFPQAIHTIGTNNAFLCNPGYGIFVDGGDVLSTHSMSAIWRKQSVPYIFDGYVGVETNLTIEPGVVLKFNSYGRIVFGYGASCTINAIGTSAEPIVFTSSNLTPAAGSWNGIEVRSNTNSNSRFEYCHFNYAGKGGNYYSSALYVDNHNGLVVKNCAFNNSAGWGMFLYCSSLSAESLSNTFTNCALGNIYSE